VVVTFQIRKYGVHVLLPIRLDCTIPIIGFVTFDYGFMCTKKRPVLDYLSIMSYNFVQSIADSRENVQGILFFDLHSALLTSRRSLCLTKGSVGFAIIYNYFTRRCSRNRRSSTINFYLPQHVVGSTFIARLGKRIRLRASCSERRFL